LKNIRIDDLQFWESMLFDECVNFDDYLFVKWKMLKRFVGVFVI